MEIIIESPHFTVNELLKEYTEKKVGKLIHFDERLIKSEVLLKLDKSKTDDNKICEVKTNGPHRSLFASSRALTFEDAISQVVHALEKQLKKEKVKARRDGKKLEINTDLDMDETE
ncbi:MAG TPA: ribosome-associated translation inhibitor RaiA [Bacteroidia bacterium]|nr:ribosome-associated translation inhibitor RaiA [Bacteroidia bacterium]